MITSRAARYLRSARRKAGLTQRALASRSGVPQPTIAAIEAGRQDPRARTLDRLLRAAGFDWDIHRTPGAGVDRTQIAAQLRLTPTQRVARSLETRRAIDEMVGTMRRR
jgi:transcriptional regulator with XRE-family HTH domain